MPRIEGPRVPYRPKPGNGAARSAPQSTAEAAPKTPALRFDPDPLGVDASTLEAVANIAADDPQRDRKVLRCFVERRLVQELVPRAMAGAALNALVEETLARMDADDALRKEMAQAVEVLRALAAQRRTGQP
jgi:hypothetical protein